MKTIPVLVLSSLVLAGYASGAPSPEFGHVGEPSFATHPAPANLFSSDRAGEPTLGIPWNTNSVFFQAAATTYRVQFDELGEASWRDVTPLYQVPINLDPMLHADPDTGRVWAGGLLGPCSVMMYSDDDGASWLPSHNMCSGVRFDHQSIGSGPAAGVAPAVGHEHVAYYCGQGGTIACARSLDGGVTWLPFQDVPGLCGGFHGHIRVSRPTGYAAVPVADCGRDHGFIVTDDGGLTWDSAVIPGTGEWTNGFDPSLQFTRGSGWLYYGMASEHGIHVALSKDEGASWEPLGQGHGQADAWLDIGALHEPPIVAGVFADVQAGDDNRVAMSFLGLEGGPGADLDFLTSPDIYQCNDRQDELVWHYYAAFSYDAGQTWDVRRISDDPVQVGGIFDVLVGGGGNCRNLLDFNDMDIDSTGRVYIGFADGCLDECARTAEPGSRGYRQEYATILRQATGLGLFAEYDQTPVSEPVSQTGSDESVPSPGSALVVAALAAAGLAGRRRATSS